MSRRKPQVPQVHRPVALVVAEWDPHGRIRERWTPYLECGCGCARRWAVDVERGQLKLRVDEDLPGSAFELERERAEPHPDHCLCDDCWSRITPHPSGPRDPRPGLDPAVEVEPDEVEEFDDGAPRCDLCNEPMGDEGTDGRTIHAACESDEEDLDADE